MRRWLAVVALAVTSMVVIAFVVPLGLLVRAQARDRALSSAQQDAQAVASGLSVAASLDRRGLTPEAAELVLAASGAPADLAIILADGSALGDPRPVSANVARAVEGIAFTADVPGGIEVLVPVSSASGTAVVRSFVTADASRSGVLTAWLVLAALGLLVIGAAVFVADRLGRSIVRPVGELAAAADRLGSGELETRVEPEGPPEIVEVSEAFNTLAARLRVLLAEERETVADLSHRLRTPLAALRLQAETGGSSPERLLEDIDRLQRAIDDLIVEARRDRDAAARSDLAAVARHQAAFWSILAEEQGRQLAVHVDGEAVIVAVDEADLRAAIDTVIENVFSHTPPGTDFTIAVAGDADVGRLVVSDDGPGFVGAAVAQRGTSTAGSTGLGLDIVRRTAERSGGGMRLGRSESGGAEVDVTFGRA